MIEVLRQDFKEQVTLDYDITYTCEFSGCFVEGICRCGTVERATVSGVNISKITNKIFCKIFENNITNSRNNKINLLIWGISEDMQRYTIDRILRANKIFDGNLWNIEIAEGYYGQEIGTVTILEEVLTKINLELQQAFLISSLSERVQYLLTIENGYLLDELESMNYSIQDIERDKLVFGNKQHQNRVQKLDLDFYSDKNYHGIRGVVIKKGDGWKIIDGYHRISKSENRFVKVIVAENI